MRGVLPTLLVSLIGCSSHEANNTKSANTGSANPPAASAGSGCEASLRSAANNVVELKDPETFSEAVADCVKNQWSVATRQCVATAREKPDLVACTRPTADGAQPAAAASLELTGIEPTKGDVHGGTFVLITGTRFMVDGARNAKVYFGSRQGTVIRFTSDSELIVQAPGGEPNETVDVRIVFTPGGERKLPRSFTFVENSD